MAHIKESSKVIETIKSMKFTGLDEVWDEQQVRLDEKSVMGRISSFSSPLNNENQVSVSIEDSPSRDVYFYM